MFFHGVNMLAVLAATLVSIALGVIWYSPYLFGRFWMREVGVTEEEIDTAFLARATRFGSGFLLHGAVFFAIALLFRYFKNVDGAVFTRIVTPVLVCALVPNLSRVVWEKGSLRHFCITGGYTLLFVLVGAGIISYWPW